MVLSIRNTLNQESLRGNAETQRTPKDPRSV